MYLILEFLLCLVALALSIFWEYRVRNKVPLHIKNSEEMLNKWRLTRFNTFVVIPPILEEMVFRGSLLIFFDVLSVNSWIAISVMSLIFAGVHNNPHELKNVEWRGSNAKKIFLRIYPQFLVSIVIGFMAIWSQSLIVAIGLHAFWNLLVWLRVQFALIEDEDDLEFSQLYTLKCIFDAWRSKGTN